MTTAIEVGKDAMWDGKKVRVLAIDGHEAWIDSGVRHTVPLKGLKPVPVPLLEWCAQDCGWYVGGVRVRGFLEATSAVNAEHERRMAEAMKGR